MIVKFLNWDKFQHRQGKRLETTRWFRFENQIIFHPIWDELNDAEFKCFVFMLCAASLNSNSGIYQHNDQACDRKSGIDKSVFSRTIKKLKRLKVVELRSQHGCYTDAASCLTTIQDKTIQDKQTNNNLPDSAFAEPRRFFDFDALYKKYPRKEGKSRGMAACKTQIKTQSDFDLLSKAIDRYSEFVKTKLSDAKYIKHFSTFMTTWRDWLDPATGTVEKTALEAPEPEWIRQARLEELALKGEK